MTPSIPEGYREDRNGRLVPEAQIKPIDLARDQLVQEKIQREIGRASCGKECRL